MEDLHPAEAGCRYVPKPNVLGAASRGRFRCFSWTCADLALGQLNAYRDQHGPPLTHKDGREGRLLARPVGRSVGPAADEYVLHMLIRHRAPTPPPAFVQVCPIAARRPPIPVREVSGEPRGQLWL